MPNLYYNPLRALVTVYKKPFVLPLSFEFRFIAGRVLQFTPVLSYLLLLFHKAGTPWIWPFFAKYLVFLALIGWVTHNQAEQERFDVERWGQRDVSFLRRWNFGLIKTDLLCLTAGALLAGLGFCIYKQDLRWVIIAIVLGVLLTVGWLLKWLVYDNWLDVQLNTEDREIIFTS